MKTVKCTGCRTDYLVDEVFMGRIYCENCDPFLKVDYIKYSHSKAPWYAVEYAGFWNLRTDNFYDVGKDVLNAEEVGSVQARKNANLARLAPQLLEALVMVKNTEIHKGTLIGTVINGLIHEYDK